MGRNTNQIATKGDANYKLGVDVVTTGTSRCIKSADLNSTPWNRWFSGGASTNKCVKYSDLTVDTSSTRSVTFNVTLSGLTDSKYWGSKNDNSSKGNTVYIKKYDNTVVATLAFTGQGTKSATVSLPYNSSGYKISTDVRFVFKEAMKVDGANPSITVQPKYIHTVTGPDGESLFSQTTNGTPYSTANFANGATIEIGSWLSQGTDVITKLPKSGTINVNLKYESTISLTRCSIPSGSAMSVGEFE